MTEPEFAPEGAQSRPLWLVPQGEDGPVWPKGVDRGFAGASGFAGKAGQLCLLPGEGGVAGALFGVGRHAAPSDPPARERFTLAKAAEALPEVVHAAAVGRILAGLDPDVVHDHSLAGPLLARGRRVPTVVTMHGPVDAEHGDIMAALGETVQVVAISDAQRKDRDDINWVATVHNAIDVDQYPFADEKDDVVLWMGRFTPDKGPELAVDAARAAGYADVVAPPMFAVVYAGRSVGPAIFDPEVGLNFGMMVHGGQEFRWGPLVVAGDEITSIATVKEISDRRGMGFYVFEFGRSIWR